MHQTKPLTPRQQAETELAGEYFRKQVDAEKARLRERRSKPFWQRIIPWKICEETMSNVKEINGKSLSPREQAQAELDAEERTKNVKLLKEKLRAVSAARTVVANLEREIADIEAAIAQGNEPD